MIIQVLIAAIQNYTGTYILMDCLQALVNNLTCVAKQLKSKLRPLNSKSISLLVWLHGARLRLVCVSVEYNLCNPHNGTVDVV